MELLGWWTTRVLAQVVSCCVCKVAKKLAQHMHGNIPNFVDCWANILILFISVCLINNSLASLYQCWIEPGPFQYKGHTNPSYNDILKMKNLSATINFDLVLSSRKGVSFRFGSPVKILRNKVFSFYNTQVWQHSQYITKACWLLKQKLCYH